MRNQAQVLLKRSCSLGKLVNTHIKEFTLLCTGKNNISISCILMALSIHTVNSEMFARVLFSHAKFQYAKFRENITLAK